MRKFLVPVSVSVEVASSLVVSALTRAEAETLALENAGAMVSARLHNNREGFDIESETWAEPEVGLEGMASEIETEAKA